MDKQDITHLSAEERHITQEKGTERPFANNYWDCHDDGVYTCKVCGAQLFDAATKFDSGTGWPSYDAPISNDAIRYAEDTTLGMPRVEALCARCGAHLGHVFNDGPTETKQRYCLNSASLTLVPPKG